MSVNRSFVAVLSCMTTTTYFRPSRIIHESRVVVGTDESIQSRFITICLSIGPNRLPYRVYKN